MRLAKALFALLLFAPGAAGALTFDESRHLLARVGFGLPSRAEIERFMPFSQESAIEEVFGLMQSKPLTQPPPEIEAPPKALGKGPDERTRHDFMRTQTQEQAKRLKAWWWGEMLATDSPFTEHMVLFWHNHFTSSLRKVKWPGFLYRQNLLFRIHAAGNFAELLREIVRDPALMIYLDSQTNRPESPNENFARELFELFTLGEGHFSEFDVKEAARAFTGWQFDPKSGEVVFRRPRHDPGEKSVLGQKVRTGDDVVRVLLEQPRTAEFITEKLWREFISDSPDADEIKRLATLFRASGYELRPLLKGLFATQAFWAPEARGLLVKSPVDLVVGTVRLLSVPHVDPRRLAQVGRALGQDLFDPPNVKGWPGGTRWISTDSLARREQFLRQIARGREGDGPDPGLGAGYNPLATDNPSIMPSLADLDRMASPRAVEALSRLLLALPPLDPPRTLDGASLRRIALGFLLDPAFEVK